MTIAASATAVEPHGGSGADKAEPSDRRFARACQDLGRQTNFTELYTCGEIKRGFS